MQRYRMHTAPPRRPRWTSWGMGTWWMVYLLALTAATAVFVPDLVSFRYYGYLQVGAAVLLTWLTRGRPPFRSRPSRGRRGGPGTGTGSFGGGPTLH